MELEIMTMFATIYLIIVLVQLAIAPDIPLDDEPKDFTPAEIEVILKKNLELVNEMLHLAETDPVMAREKLQEYSKKLLSEDAKWMLKQIVEVPEKICLILKPVVMDMHKKLEQESYVYRVFGNIGLNFVKSLGYIGLNSMGFLLRTLGDLTQVINHFVEESATAATHKEETLNRKPFSVIHSVAEIAKSFGAGFESGARVGLYNMIRRHRLEQNQLDPSKHPSVQLSRSRNGAR